MASPQQVAWLKVIYSFAKMAAASVNQWPLRISRQDYARAAACEAANETGWGAHTPPKSNNVLGIQALGAYAGPHVAATGSEDTAAGVVTSPHNWRVYTSPGDCFANQLHILGSQKNPDGSLTYQAAMDAPDVQSYIRAECAKWSTNPNKAGDVLETLAAHLSDLP